MNALLDILWIVNLVTRAHGDRARRREWEAGRAARIQAEIDRSNHFIEATFPPRAKARSPHPPAEEEAR